MIKTTSLGAKEAWENEILNAFRLAKGSDNIKGIRIEGCDAIYTLYDNDGNQFSYSDISENISKSIEEMIASEKYPSPSFVLHPMRDMYMRNIYVIVIQPVDFEKVP